MPRLHLGFFASHGGSNMQAIIDACRSGALDAEPCVVISNNSASGAGEKARAAGIPFCHISSKKYPGGKEFTEAILTALGSHGVDTVILAGYMKKLPAEVIARYSGRILNIHPALLPKYGGEGMYGIHVHEAVLAAGDTETGVTIHLVDEHYDHGRILAQQSVPVLPGDTPETLAARVLETEHSLYTATLQRIASGEIEI